MNYNEAMQETLTKNKTVRRKAWPEYRFAFMSSVSFKIYVMDEMASGKVEITPDDKSATDWELIDKQ